MVLFFPLCALRLYVVSCLADLSESALRHRLDSPHEHALSLFKLRLHSYLKQVSSVSLFSVLHAMFAFAYELQSSAVVLASASRPPPSGAPNINDSGANSNSDDATTTSPIVYFLLAFTTFGLPLAVAANTHGKKAHALLADGISKLSSSQERVS